MTRRLTLLQGGILRPLRKAKTWPWNSGLCSLMKKKMLRPGEIFQWLNTLIAFAENLSILGSQYSSWVTNKDLLTLAAVDLLPSTGLYWHIHIVVYIHWCTHTHNWKINLKRKSPSECQTPLLYHPDFLQARYGVPTQNKVYGHVILLVI